MLRTTTLLRVRLVLLALLLVLDQHGALLHQLGHLHSGAATGVTLQADEHATDGTSCPTCDAFAQITNPASGTAHIVPACPAAFLPAPDPSYIVADAFAPRPRSRGPPLI